MLEMALFLSFNFRPKTRWSESAVAGPIPEYQSFLFLACRKLFYDILGEVFINQFDIMALALLFCHR